MHFLRAEHKCISSQKDQHDSWWIFSLVVASHSYCTAYSKGCAFLLFISIRMSWFQNHTAWPKLKQWLSRMKLIWPHVAATLLIIHNRYNGKFEGRLAQKSLRHKEECTKTGRLSFVKTPLGKISAQPHTIVTQICFPNGNVLFLSLFSLSKNWMFNVG